MTFSPDMLDKASRAAGHINAAASSMRILGSLEWDPGFKDAFLTHGTLPAPTYEWLDLEPAFKHLKDAEVLIEGDNVVADWLRRTSDSVETTALMLAGRGTPDFFMHSAKLYGVPTETLIDRKTRVIDMANHMDNTLEDLDFDQLVMDGYQKWFGAKEFAARLKPLLGEHFGEAAPRIEILEEMSAKASASSYRIKVRADAEFTARDVDQLLQHEALIHVATSLNGKAQNKFPFLGRAHAATTEIQEGLAVFAEIMSGAMSPRRFLRLSDRVIAIQMTIDGADFKEVFDFHVEQAHGDRELAYDNTRRIFRGGVLSGGAPFTKDMVYLNGLLRVHNFMRTVVKLGRADLIRLLFVGKLDLEDVPALAELATAGMIQPAKYMPAWVKDLRFLVSYLGYSSFLNQVKMPGFQSYYEDYLEHVPVLWDVTG